MNPSRPREWFARNKRKMLLFLVIFLGLVALVTPAIYVYHRSETQSQLKQIQVRETGQVRIYAAIITQMLEELKSDLLSLSGNHLIPLYLSDSHLERLRNLEIDFATYIAAKKRYDQIRIISKEGDEILRVNFDGGKCRIVPAAELQPKAHRYYSQQALAFSPGQVYLSRFDLNVERHKIEKPLKPMLRLATALKDNQGRKKAILVLNYLGNDLFTRLKTARNTANGQLMLLNQAGYWLKAPRKADEWGFMLPGGKNKTFSRRFPAAWRLISSQGEGQALLDRGLFTFITLKPSEILHISAVSGSERWIVLSWINPAALEGLLGDSGREHLLLWLTLTLMSLPVAWLVASSLERWRRADEQVRILSRFPAENPNPVLRATAEGLVTYANPASRELLRAWRIREGSPLPRELAELFEGSPGDLQNHGLEIKVGEKDQWFLAVPLADSQEVYLYGRDITELKRARETIKEAEERYRLLGEEAPVSIMTFDQDGIVTFVNKWHLEKFGRGKRQTDFYVGKPIDQLPGLIGGGLHQKLKKVLEGQTVDLPSVYIGQFSGGQSGYQNIRAVPLVQGGEIAGGIIIREDITEFKKAHDQLEMARKVFDNAIEGIVVTDGKGDIQFVNNAFSKITGYGADEVIGQNPRLLKSDRHGPEFYQEMWRSLGATGRWQGEIWNRRKNGEAYPEWLAITAIAGDRPVDERYVALFHDTSDLRRAEEEIEFKSNYDALTGLLNREVFEDRLTVALAHLRAGQEKLVIFSADLDNFKVINNSLGHMAGDELLQQVARQLELAGGGPATVARLGGDEFLIMVEGLASSQEARQWAQSLLESLAAKPYEIRGREIFITMSIGIALAPDDGQGADTLIKNADLAMLRAKQCGRNRCDFFSQLIGHAAEERLSLENSLRWALQKEEFEVYFQPKVELAPGRIKSMEALVRWQRPGHGLVPPDEFIHLAEATGLIVPLGEWVLRESCRQTKALWDAGFSGLTVAVNLSVRQLQEADLAQRVREVLLETGLPTEGLSLEVTESAVMADAQGAETLLRELHAMGIRISLDDFGTGYSLALLPPAPAHRFGQDRQVLCGRHPPRCGGQRGGAYHHFHGPRPEPGCYRRGGRKRGPTGVFKGA